ncbi:hypothetical protein R5R35_000048 [Gryllus longicercus]|nr:uncharacterized protein LOC108740908 [Gryllus bimaculatus]
MLYNAVVITEMAMDLKERAASGEKYVCYLRSLAVRAARVITAMQHSGRSFILLAHKLSASAIKGMDANCGNDTIFFSLRNEFEKLLTILDKELADMEDIETTENVLANDINNMNLASIMEKIKNLEARTKVSDSAFVPASNSARSFKSDVDEKYPESWSRESLIDLHNVVNLPPVPEDIFTGFSKPVRTSSLSSLKSLRKVKLFLQKAASSEEEESECEDLLVSDEPSAGEKDTKIPIKKHAILGNIKEEA